jgi:hypothetical protein
VKRPVGSRIPAVRCSRRGTPIGARVSPSRVVPDQASPDLDIRRGSRRPHDLLTPGTRDTHAGWGLMDQCTIGARPRGLPGGNGGVKPRPSLPLSNR